MKFGINTKQRTRSIQGLRSFRDTLPKNIKRMISKKGHIYSETLNNWKFMVGDKIFKFTYPRSFRHTNKFSKGALTIMVKRGHEIDVEYSKNQIIDKINIYFGYKVIDKIKLISFNDRQDIYKKNHLKNKNMTHNKHVNKIINIKNDKIKKSLLELSKLFSRK